MDRMKIEVVYRILVGDPTYYFMEDVCL